jgi:hypothetical protein
MGEGKICPKVFYLISGDSTLFDPIPFGVVQQSSIFIENIKIVDHFGRRSARLSNKISQSVKNS